LLINASQRVLWDPPEHSAIQRSLNVTTFISASRRSRNCTFRFIPQKRSTLIQELDVTPEVAELAMRLAIANGPTPKGRCSSHNVA
jgi:hypothetical protein